MGKKRLTPSQIAQERFSKLESPHKQPKRAWWKGLLKIYLLIVFAFFASIYLFWGLPLPTQLTSETQNPVSTKILDRNGKLIYEIFEEKRRTPVELGELPPHVTQATLAIEDKDFYKHPGFSPIGWARAVRSIVFEKKLEGGSTITQQLVKNSLLTPERTLRRKIRELVLAIAVEIIYPKDRILELYLNNVPYGGTAWGIESAAQTYFGKKASDLTLAEASLLAGLPVAPTKYSPFGARPELAKERQKAVLRRMVEDGYITKEAADKAAEESLAFKKPEGLEAPHFVLWVKEQLVEKYGQSRVERGGLIVTTTLDLDLQRFAQDVVATEVARLKRERVGNGAAVVTAPATGEILAMVGSKDYFAQDEDGKVNVTLRPRQPGSSIKPLNYALALWNRRLTAAAVIHDIPTCFQVVGQPLYCPVNYDGQFHGPVHTRFALGNSYNIPAVKTLTINGLSDFVEFARKVGITTFEDPSNYGLSLTLGGGEVRMIDMAEAFGVFANGGVRQPLISVLKVEDWKGEVLEEAKAKEGDRVIPMEVSFLVSDILRDNGARTQAFGPSSFLVVDGHPEVSVKTGTTNDKRDNWAIGFSPEVVVATWVGNNDNTPMSAVASGVTGASPVWNRIIKYALDKIEAGELSSHGQERKRHGHVMPQKPDGVIGATVCSLSGLLPPESGCETRFEYFIDGTVPSAVENLKRGIPIDKATGGPITGNTPPDEVEMQEHLVLFDVLGTQLCLDCPTPEKPVVINPTEVSVAPRGDTSPIGGE